MFTVRVNGQDIQLDDHEQINAIQAAQRIEVEVPHYCWHPELTVVASCRMCLVEQGEQKPDGSIAMLPKLVPGCQTPMKPGTVIVTDSPKVKEAQQATLEYLLLNHPLDCPVCDQAGECFLQDYSFKFGRGHTRLHEPKLKKQDKDHIGEHITLFTDRCVMCSRCVRFTREISGTSELQVIQRGSHAEIDIFPGEPCNNKLAGNVVDLCPVGALCSKDFLYQQRVWWLKSKESVCPGCSTGCSIRVDANENVLYRLRPRPNPNAQGYFMCDEGRFGAKYVNGETRLHSPQIRDGNGELTNQNWHHAYDNVRTRLTEIAKQSPQSLAAVLSPWMTVEEAYLLASYMKKLSPDIRLALGTVRVEGEDDCYPKDIHGKALPNPKFTIRAEKCPNRLGVEAVLKHYEGQVVGFPEVLAEIQMGSIDAMYLVGGDPGAWLSQAQAAPLSQLKYLVVQDMLPSEAIACAHVVLPGVSFAEKEGTFVNHAGLAQQIQRALMPAGEARMDGRILWELAGRTGLFHAPTLREEIAQTIPSLQNLPAKMKSSGAFLSENATDGKLVSSV